MELTLRKVADMQLGLKAIASITENREYLKTIRIDDKELFYLSFNISQWIVNTQAADDLFTTENRKLYSKYGVETVVDGKPTGQFILKSESIDIYNELYMELCKQPVTIEGPVIKLSTLQKLKVGGFVLTSLSPIINLDLEVK